MDYATFERHARAAWKAIPPEFRQGIEGLEVSRATEPHPTLPEIYTLGECKTEPFPTEFGGVGEVLSTIVLYHGSFVALARLDPDFDWEEEIWETVTHEVRHHLESQAAEDALEVTDYAEDQNFARREGEPFDPFFYRSGARRGEAAWEVDGDIFMEVPLPGDGSGPLVIRWRGRRFRLPVPLDPGDVTFASLGDAAEGGEIVAVLLRRRGWRGWMRSLLGSSRLDVRQISAPG